MRYNIIILQIYNLIIDTQTQTYICPAIGTFISATNNIINTVVANICTTT
jgi:hypothetical protein